MFNWEGAELPGHRFEIAPGTGLDGLEGIPAGTKFAFYGGWLYRRYTAVDLTPPGLPRPIYTDLDHRAARHDEDRRLRLTQAGRRLSTNAGRRSAGRARTTAVRGPGPTSARRISGLDRNVRLRVRPLRLRG